MVGVGSLQMVIDRGERLDWFASPFIARFSIVAAVTLVLFVIHELRTRDPVVDLRVFRDRTFSSGNAIMFFGFFAFFASIVLLPIYTQKLMGYTSWWAGWVLAPGGIASFFVMPFAGKLMTRTDPRRLLFAGIFLNGVALLQMSRFNLAADFGTIMWPRLVQGVGLGLFFVPLAATAVSGISREKMGNATAVYNFMRNMGGSFGVALMTTQLARRAQFHQHRLVEHLTPYDMPFQKSLTGVREWLESHHGLGDMASLKSGFQLIYGQMNRHAFMLSIDDAFYLNAVIFFATLALVFFMRKPAPRAGPADTHG